MRGQVVETEEVSDVQFPEDMVKSDGILVDVAQGGHYKKNGLQLMLKA